MHKAACQASIPEMNKQSCLVFLAATDGGAWTLVSTDGSTHGHEAIELDPHQRQDTLAVELLEEDVPLAMGTIQIAELHKVGSRAAEHSRRGAVGYLCWVACAESQGPLVEMRA
jgi:hypothetical protein